MFSAPHHLQRQQGAVLIISIVLLVVMTLLGLYLSQSGILEMRMSENAASRSIAFQRAETARSQVEQAVNPSTDPTKGLAHLISQNSGVLDCQKEGAGYYAAAAANATGCSPLDLQKMSWDDTDSKALGGNTRYAIEYLGTDCIAQELLGTEMGGTGEEVFIFRITARGAEDAGGVVTIQSIYTVRKGTCSRQG
jgi:type IV pilus assembly protein PilX